MSETLQVIIAGLIVLIVGIPSVIILTKWKNEMEEELKAIEKDGEDDVCSDR